MGLSNGEILVNKFKNIKTYLSGLHLYLKRFISSKREDYLSVIVILLISLPIWLRFGNNNFIIFWDGWFPMVPSLQWVQNFNTIYLPQIGSGVYSLAYSSYSIYLSFFTFFAVLFGPINSERIVYYLSYALSGIFMYYLIREFSSDRRSPMAPLVGALCYLLNFYWISGVFEDLIIPTVLTFLPFFFLIYRRYLYSIKKKVDVLSPYLFLSILSIGLVSGIFYQASFATFILILIYTLFSFWFLKERKVKRSSILIKMAGFFSFISFFLITYSYFLLPQFLFSNLIGNYSGVSSFSICSVQNLTSKATLFNVLRDIQPSSFFYAPFSYNINVINFTSKYPFYISFIPILPTLFAFISPFFAPKKYRNETLSLLFILILVIYIQMGISGPFPSFYIWLGEHLPLGTVLEDPNITIGFLEPFLISVLVGIGLIGMLEKVEKTRNTKDNKRLNKQKVNEKIRNIIPKSTENSRHRKVISYFFVALIIGSSLFTALPIFSGSFIPEYNSLNESYLGPEISSHVRVDQSIKEVMNNLRNIVEGKRVLVLPLESGINMQTGNLSYVTSNNVLQLETGADIVSDNEYGFGANSSYILSSINDLIYNTYYFLQKNYSMDNYYISTTNFSNFLTSFGIKYVLVVPRIPETPINSYYPLVTYNMSVFFMKAQKNLTVIYSKSGYILFKNTKTLSDSSQKIDNIYSSKTNYIISNSTSYVRWNCYNSTRNIIPISFDKGFIFHYHVNQSTVFILPASLLNVSSYNYSFMNVIGKAINASVSFYYVYEFGENYSFTNNYGTSWFQMTRYSQYDSSISQTNSFENLTFSTSIPYLPFIGIGNVSKIDWIEIAITPNTGLIPGSEFGFEINSMYFSNYSSSLSAISITLSNNPNTDYISGNSWMRNLGKISLTPSSEVKVSQPSKYEYMYHIIDSSGSVLLNLPITYSPYWEYSIISGIKNISMIRHFETNGYQNSYLVIGYGNATIEVVFEPHKMLFLLETLSSSTIISECLYLFYQYRKKISRLIKDKQILNK